MFWAIGLQTEKKKSIFEVAHFIASHEQSPIYFSILSKSFKAQSNFKYCFFVCVFVKIPATLYECFR